MPAPSRWRAGTCANGCSRWASRRRARRRGLILFAWATWIYRLVLFLGIAALVYHFFIKALGIFLFLVEIVVHRPSPVVRDRRMAGSGAAIGGSRRARWSALLLILIVLGAFAPWPVPRGSGLLQAREQWPHAPEASRLASPRRPRGTRCRPMRTLSCWTRLRWPPAPRKARRARCNWRGSPPPPASIPNCDATGRCCASARPRRRRSRSRWTAKRRATAWKRQAPAGCATVIRTCARATGWAAASCWDAS